MRRTGLSLVAAALLAGCASPPAGPPAAVGSPAPAPAQHRPTPPAATEPGDTAPTAGPTLGSRPATLDALREQSGRRPVRVRLGRGRPAPVQASTTDPVSGGLTLPPEARTVAWWSSGVAPGDPAGTAVLAAHVAYRGQTGPFTTLATLGRGELVEVVDSTGATHTYRTTATRLTAKTALDRAGLFRGDGPPRLALITCGGRYDPQRRSYDDNVVVLAEPVAG